MLTGDRLHIVSSSYDLSHFVFDFHSATQDLVCTWYPLTPLLLPPHCAQFVSPYAKDSSTILFGWEKYFFQRASKYSQRFSFAQNCYRIVLTFPSTPGCICTTPFHSPFLPSYKHHSQTSSQTQMSTKLTFFTISGSSRRIHRYASSLHKIFPTNSI